MSIQQAPPPAPPAQASPPQTPAPAADIREAFILDARVLAARFIGSLAVVGTFMGLIGGVATLNEKSIFDLASSTFQVYKPGWGYLAGPLLIAALWPRQRKAGSVSFAYAHHYRPRIAIAAALWIVGMIVLAVSVGGLSEAYTIETGTYVAAGLLTVGLLATLAMWPSGLRLVHVDQAGQFQERVTAPGPVAPPSAPPTAAAPSAPPSAPPTAAAPSAPPSPPPAGIAPNWYEDPLGEGQYRYWDGQKWTSYTTGEPGDRS